LTVPIEAIEAAMKSALCGSMSAVAVPAGYFVETGFRLPDGDLLSFYVVNERDGTFAIEDDGDTLPMAIAMGFDIRSSAREANLRAILEQEGAAYDDALIIRAEGISRPDLGAAALRFISAMIRMRDLFLIDRENVVRAFSDDIRSAIQTALPQGFMLDDTGGRENLEPDIVIRNARNGLVSGRIYAAGGDLRLMDALVSWQAREPESSPIVAVVDRRAKRVSDARFNRANNIGLPLAAFDGFGNDWLDRVLRIVANSDAAPKSSLLG